MDFKVPQVYEIDFSKVKTVKDIKEILKILDLKIMEEKLPEDKTLFKKSGGETQQKVNDMYLQLLKQQTKK